jgi:hypothetical protein
MDHLKRFFFRLYNSTQNRKASRSLLRAARKGNSENYLALAASYLDLTQAFLGASFAETDLERSLRTERIFLRLWSKLPYAERLSDYEYMLTRDLLKESCQANCVLSPEPLVTKLRMLEPMTRFSILAYEFEKWPLRWVALVMRIRVADLHRVLSEARCELCGIVWDSLTEQERSLLQEVSVSLDKCPNLKINKALAEKIKSYPRVAEIKALWLELRPELVEVRHRYIPDQDVRETILKQIFIQTSQTPMLKPAVIDRMLNTVNFSRHGDTLASGASGN